MAELKREKSDPMAWELLMGARSVPSEPYLLLHGDSTEGDAWYERIGGLVWRGIIVPQYQRMNREGAD